MLSPDGGGARLLRAAGLHHAAETLTDHSYHDALVGRVARRLAPLPEGGTLYVDYHHYTPPAAPNVRGANVGTWQNHISDTVCARFDSVTLVIEVERPPR